MNQPTDAQLALIRAASDAMETTDEPFVRLAACGPEETTTLLVFTMLVDNRDVGMAIGLMEPATSAIAADMRPLVNVRPAKEEQH